MKYLKKIAWVCIIALILSAGGYKAYATFYPAQLQQFQLCGSGASVGDTTICLQSMNDIAGNQVTMSYFGTEGFGTIDPNNGSQEEAVTWTGVAHNANGTVTLSGVNDTGLSQPFTLTGNLTKNHAGGATFVVTNTAYWYYRIYVNADDPVSAQNIATKNYVDGRVFGGIGNASETATGTVQIATQTQAASSTMNGSLGRLVLPSSMSTSTYNASTAALRVVMTGNNGKIDSNFLLASASATGMNLWVATSTQQFTVPNGITTADVQCVGAGGNGGVNGSSVGVGGGGGSGEYIRMTVNLTGTTSVQVVIAAGGSQNPTSFGNFLTANAGSTGGNANGALTTASGGVGGAASTTLSSLMSIAGTTGGGGISASPSSNQFGFGGTGAGSVFGGGGAGAVSTGGSAANGTNATAWGAGGGGAYSVSGVAGLGQYGACIVRY